MFDCKIEVTSVRESREVQRKLLKMGVRGIKGKKVLYNSASYLYVVRDVLGFGKNKNFFDECDLPKLNIQSHVIK